MTHAHEAVKTRHKESSLVFPVLALAVLFFWGSSQSLPVVIAINILCAGRHFEAAPSAWSATPTSSPTAWANPMAP